MDPHRDGLPSATVLVVDYETEPVFSHPSQQNANKSVSQYESPEFQNVVLHDELRFVGKDFLGDGAELWKLTGWLGP